MSEKLKITDGLEGRIVDENEHFGLELDYKPLGRDALRSILIENITTDTSRAIETAIAKYGYGFTLLDPQNPPQPAKLFWYTDKGPVVSGEKFENDSTQS